MMGLATILNEGENGLLKVLSLKADKDDLEKLYENKTEKRDSENMMDFLLESNRIVQHIIILLNETLKLSMMTDGKVARENRTHELISQV